MIHSSLFLNRPCSVLFISEVTNYSQQQSVQSVIQKMSQTGMPLCVFLRSWRYRIRSSDAGPAGLSDPSPGGGVQAGGFHQHTGHVHRHCPGDHQGTGVLSGRFCCLSHSRVANLPVYSALAPSPGRDRGKVCGVLWARRFPAVSPGQDHHRQHVSRVQRHRQLLPRR